MTGLMPEKEFSRKSFVKGGGALIVGFSARRGAAPARRGARPATRRSRCAARTTSCPTCSAVDSWIAITADNTVIVTHGETELGHGTPTGILMLVAEELNMNMDQMVYAHPETWLNATGGGGGTGGISSRSTQTRAAAAYAQAGAARHGVDEARRPGRRASRPRTASSPAAARSVKYGDLLGGKLFNFEMPLVPPAPRRRRRSYIPGTGITKPVSQYKLVGTVGPADRHPGEGRRAPTPTSRTSASRACCTPAASGRAAPARTRRRTTSPLSVDATSIAHIPGAQVVQIGNFLAVVAPKEYDAIQAAAQLKVVWKNDPKFTPLRATTGRGCARPATRTPSTRPATPRTPGGVPAALASAAQDGVGDLPLPLQQLRADRPARAVADVNDVDTAAIVYVQGQSLQRASRRTSPTMLGSADHAEHRCA